ncbi:hypothetical protein [Methylobacterium sp. JK268]
MSASDEEAREARTDRPVTAPDLEGIAAVPKDGADKPRRRDSNQSGANAADRQGNEVDPGTG